MKKKRQLSDVQILTSEWIVTKCMLYETNSGDLRSFRSASEKINITNKNVNLGLHDERGFELSTEGNK